jgi:hypothetical protein
MARRFSRCESSGCVGSLGGPEADGQNIMPKIYSLCATRMTGKPLA